ncbi:MAG: Maf family protein [Anaerosomatales bacterium]|nr:Maf family protein [Anaerosomatales bacterium]
MRRMAAADEYARIVLASASPRRQRLIEWLCVPFVVRPTDVDEPLDLPLSPEELATHLAASKALSGARHAKTDEVVLGFDTLVVLDGVLMGKPTSDEEARSMLSRLSGRHHQVVTGVAIAVRGALARSFAVTTDVEMRTLTPDEVEGWIARGEHLGCAGAYNIEHHLARVTDDECFQNVAGLPLCHLYAELASGRLARLPGLTPPVARCDAALGRACTLGPRVCGIMP